MAPTASELKKLVLHAAIECSHGDLQKTFTSEELLVSAWERDPISWGLRGFEHKHPDSHRIHRELDSRGKKNKGLVDLGFLEKVQARVYRLTPKGLAAASELKPEDAPLRERADRALEAEIRGILEHPVFRSWIKDSNQPTRFREAGRFWRVAPGTPSRVIRERIQTIERTLTAALDTLERKGVEQIADGHRRVLYDRTDVERCMEFHETLKRRFAADLRLLGMDEGAA